VLVHFPSSPTGEQIIITIPILLITDFRCLFSLPLWVPSRLLLAYHQWYNTMETTSRRRPYLSHQGKDQYESRLACPKRWTSTSLYLSTVSVLFYFKQSFSLPFSSR
jgi:hypothetical protein